MHSKPLLNIAVKNELKKHEAISFLFSSVSTFLSL